MKRLDPWSLELRGTRLIEASAGTGKTHTLTTLYLRLVVEEQLLPSQILVVTYTQAATAELQAAVTAAKASREASGLSRPIKRAKKVCIVERFTGSLLSPLCDST